MFYKKRKRRYYKAEETVRILQACKGELEYALIMTLVDSGCRMGGLSRLKGKDVGGARELMKRMPRRVK